MAPFYAVTENFVFRIYCFYVLALSNSDVKLHQRKALQKPNLYILHYIKNAKKNTKPFTVLCFTKMVLLQPRYFSGLKNYAFLFFQLGSPFFLKDDLKNAGKQQVGLVTFFSQCIVSLKPDDI